MFQGKVRHLFPGGNTALGFYSFYSSIITQEEADRLIILKGGPGVGKSTFMKKIGEEMLRNGYGVEFLHCSSDNNSLDGVKIPELKTAFIDGTAPHVVDPKSPGAVDKILNFGDFWDEDGIRVHKEAIIETSKEIGSIFARAYKYLKAAFSIYEDSTVINNAALRKGDINLFTKKLEAEIFDGMETANEEGGQRSLFASAITPNGYRNYLDSILTVGKVYEITGGIGTAEDKIIDKIRTAAMERGCFVEAYYCALNPYKLEHLVIPALDVAITASNAYHTSLVSKSASIDIRQFYDPIMLEKYKDDLNENKKEFEKLMSVALATISKAKALHDKLETYYIPYIDFKAIDTCLAKTINMLLRKN